MENKKGKTPQELVNALNSMAGDVAKDPKLQQLQTDSQMLTYEQVLENPAEISCRNGTVFGMNSSPLKDASNKCRKYIEDLIVNCLRHSCLVSNEGSLPQSIYTVSSLWHYPCFSAGTNLKPYYP